MRAGNRNCNFPGVDRRVSGRFASDVAADEQAIIAEIRALREREGVRLEALGFLLGADPAQLSRHLNGTSNTSLVNYLRITRALGYRCRVVLEKAASVDGDANALSDLKILPIKAQNARSTGSK